MLHKGVLFLKLITLSLKQSKKGRVWVNMDTQQTQPHILCKAFSCRSIY